MKSYNSRTQINVFLKHSIENIVVQKYDEKEYKNKETVFLEKMCLELSKNSFEWQKCQKSIYN